MQDNDEREPRLFICRVAKGEIIIVRHDNGSILTVLKRLNDEYNRSIGAICAIYDIIVALTKPYVQIRNYSD